ncbi:MAG: helix-turn-helix transcriptional regulator [Rikenellaceae bacterium]
MIGRTNYITGKTSEFNEFRASVPVYLELGGFMLCTSGSAEVVVDMKQYKIKVNDLVVAFPHSYVHAIHTSDDFDGVIFGVNIDTLISTDISNRSFYLIKISQNPCISLKEEETQKILRIRDYFLNENINGYHPLRKEIDEAILKIMIYEIAAFYHHSTPNIEQKKTRDNIIFNNFIIKLYSDKNNNRSLDYFAAEQSVTPSHLSKVIKRVTGRSGSDWISSYTIVKIKRLLQDKDMPILIIADTLGFPNASFLSQYFKKQTNQTPREYRTEYFSKLLNATSKISQNPEF